LTRATVIEIRDEVLEDRAAGTVNRYLATLRHAFNIAVTDWEWASKNPLQRIKLPEPRGRDRHVQDDEIKALLGAFKESDHPHLYPAVWVALTTGAIRGEILGLRWRDIDLSTRRATLHDTKNEDKRTLALAPQVVEALRELQKVRRTDSDLIFDMVVNGGGKRTYTNYEGGLARGWGAAERWRRGPGGWSTQECDNLEPDPGYCPAKSGAGYTTDRKPRD